MLFTSLSLKDIQEAKDAFSFLCFWGDEYIFQQKKKDFHKKSYYSVQTFTEKHTERVRAPNFLLLEVKNELINVKNTKGWTFSKHLKKSDEICFLEFYYYWEREV